ncbi:MAG: type IV pilin [Methanolinea sp.]|nr:type IV pilin [Methanolinea sp.]
MNRQQDAGVNEVIASILMVALVIVLAIIIGSIVFGVIVLQPKSAYIPPRVEVVNVSGVGGQQQVISLYSRGGDQAFLQKGDGVQYALGIYVETGSASYRVTPDPGVETFSPGQTLFIYNSSSGFRATDNMTGKALTPLPPGSLTLRLVDENAKLLVYKEGLAIGGGGTVSPTITPIPACGTISGKVYNDQNNNGLAGWTVQYRFRSNQGQAQWSAWVSTTTGPSGTYTFTGLVHSPAHNYEVEVIVPNGWVVTQPTSNYSFILNPGDQCYQIGIDFGLQQK